MAPHSQSELLRLAGDRAYERGAAYYDEGRVTRMTRRGEHITATVEGTYAYDVRLRQTVRGLEGGCSCPASEGFDFCKHCVAVGLALQVEESAQKLAAKGDSTDRMRVFLARQPHDELVEMLISVLPDHPELRDRLAMQEEIAAAVLDAKRLKKLITAALPMRDIWEHDQVLRYFARAEATIGGMRSIATEISPQDLLATVLHAIKRLNRALERVDDSSGHRWTIQCWLRELHTTALAGLEWAPDKLASHLLDLTLEDPWDQFADVLDEYADVLGDEGRAAFFAQVQSRLDALPPLPFGADFEQKYPYLQLASLLQEEAVADNDIDTLIALARRVCTDASGCCQLTELFLEQRELDQALTWLDKADEAAKPRSRSHALRVAVHSARAEWLLAADAQRKVFEEKPSVPAYRRLEEIATKAGTAVQALAETKGFLRANLQSVGLWRETCAETLADIARSEGDMSQAFELVYDHIFDAHRLVHIAKWFEGRDSGQTTELIARAIEKFIGRKNKRGYQEAVTLLVNNRGSFDRQGDGAFDAFVADLRQRHKPKRNLMALLKDVH